MTGCRSGWRSSFWLIPLTIRTNKPIPDYRCRESDRRRPGAPSHGRRGSPCRPSPRGAVLQRGRLLPGRHRGRGDRRARRAAAADHARAEPVGGVERRDVGRRRRARAVRGLDPGVLALVRRARPRAARVRPHAALPGGLRRLRAVRAAPRGSRRRPALDRRGRLRRLHRRAGDPARPRDVPDRPPAQPHPARVPAHLLEQPRRARRRRPGARAPRHIVDPPAGGRALAAAAFPAVAVCLYFTFSRGGSIAVVFGVAVYLVLGYSRGFVPAFIALVPTTAFALQRAFDADLLAGARFEQPVAAAQRGDLLTVVVACARRGGAAAGAAAVRGSPARAHSALAPRAPGRQARRRLARRVHRRRCRGGRRARARRASASRADCEAAAVRR